MKIYGSNFSAFSVQNPIVTIGTFDGVHNGHRKIIAQLLDIAQQSNGEAVIFTFWPHPRTILATDNFELKLLNTFDERVELLENAGIKNIIVYPFSSEFSKLSYSDFVRRILVDELKIHSLVLGYDNRIGHKGAGNIHNIKQLADELGFNFIPTEALNINTINISSSIIREALNMGRVEVAGKYLSYNYFIQGKVVEGNKIGRKIEFPTANVEVDNMKLIPACGVYAVKVKIAENQYNGMLNIGYRPTIEESSKQKRIEVHIFDFDGELYGTDLRIEFVEKVRDEIKFSSLDELKAQLSIDKQNIKKLYSHNTST